MNVDVDIDSGHVVASRVDVALGFPDSLHRSTEVVTFHGGGEYRAGHEEVFGPVDSDKQRPDRRGSIADRGRSMHVLDDAIAWFTSGRTS